MKWTQIRFYYILIFCTSKTWHSFLKIQNPPIYHNRQNDVLGGKMNMEAEYNVNAVPNFQKY